MNALTMPANTVVSQQNNSTIRKMKMSQRWLLWKYIPDEEGKKPRKFPCYIDGSPRTNLDQSGDWVRLATYDQAVEALSKGGYEGLGFALGPDGTGKHWQGFDFDNVSTDPNEQPYELRLFLSSQSDWGRFGYAEVSPSRRGVHVIGYGQFFPSRTKPFEAYSDGRFFTFTDMGIPSLSGEKRPDTLVDLSTFFDASAGRTPARLDTENVGEAIFATDQTMRDLWSALEYLAKQVPSYVDGEGTWFETAFALASACHPWAEEMFVAWSKLSSRWGKDWSDSAGEKDARVKFRRGVRETRTSYKAIFARAQEYGWENPSSNAANLQNGPTPEPTPGNVDISGIMQQAKNVTSSSPVALVSLKYATAADTATAGIDYLMEPFLPAKCVVGFYGRGSSAKSSFLATLCAEISPKASSLWVSTEEPADWIRVRHMKAGGLERSLAVVEAATKTDRNGQKISTSFNIYEHLEPAIIQSNMDQRSLSRPDTKMVVLDTAVALTTWGQKENPNDDASVKRLLTYLRNLCEKHGVTICVIGHSNKSVREHLADQVMGAAAWTNTPRLSFIHAADIHDDYRYVLRVAKSNFNVFGMSYNTIPVHTLHKSEFGPDTVLVKVQMDREEIVWGEVESREMFDAATKKTRDEDCEGFSIGLPKHELFATKIQQMLSQHTAGMGITRPEVEAEMGEKLDRARWLKVERYLKENLSGTIAIERGNKNKIIYKQGSA